MKIMLIGSHAYRNRMEEAADKLKEGGYEVLIPAFDDHPEWNEYEICMYNLSLMKEAEEVWIYWDRRSMGTVFDFGMAFALGKRVYLKYLEPKTMENVMKAYSYISKHETIKN
jgi:nucleoside 2-deoxyribosyltransferase